MDYDTDVIIVGAGPAGLTAARELAKSDIDYILITKEDTPCKDKVCGGFVPRRALSEFEIPPVEGEHRIHSIRMKFPDMNIVRVDFDDSIGVNVTRKNLGKMMLDLIPGHQHNIRMNRKVGKIENNKTEAKVTFSNQEDQTETLTSKVLIDASGTNSVSTKLGIVRSRIHNDGMGYGFQLHLKSNDLNHDFHGVNDFFYGHEFSPGGYAWIFPRKNEVVVGTGGLVNSVRGSTKTMKDYLSFLISDTEPIRSELKETSVIKKDAALMPLAGVVTPSYDRRVLLVGDAAGHCSPLTGEGIHYSMIGGQLAARTIADILAKGKEIIPNLSRYESAWTKKIGSDLKWGLWLQKRFTSQGSSSISSSFLKSKKSQKLIGEMIVGDRSVRSAIISAVPGYVKSKLGF